MSIGVTISSQKTHESVRFYVFAKRLFLDQIEITPFPISALKECGKSFDSLTTLLWE